MKKVLLAFSGGLDTSYCVKYLQMSNKFEVHTAIVNSGGFSRSELEQIKERALSLGAVSHATLEKKDEYYNRIIKYLIFGNVLKNGNYPLSVSAERVCQALALVEFAKSNNFKFIAHGSTGAGNDQIRFDLIFQILAPEIKVITPIRDGNITRENEIIKLQEWGVNWELEKGTYSINKGLWGTSIGGLETLTSHLSLPDSAFASVHPMAMEMEIELNFCKGEIVALNNEKFSGVQLIEQLNTLGEKFGLGKGIHTGDTIVGIKGRVGFQAAAAALIISAHQTLEKHTLSKWQLYWKNQLSEWYGMLLHEGQYFDPVMRNIERFLEDTQLNVNGKVFLKLKRERFEVTGISSPNDLMKAKFGQYGEHHTLWSGDDVKGFTKILSNSGRIYNSVNSVL